MKETRIISFPIMFETYTGNIGLGNTKVIYPEIIKVVLVVIAIMISLSVPICYGNPVIININTKDPCDQPNICGVEGSVGCSGDPNPPTVDDMKQFAAGNFTSRQDDIMIGTCYSPMNMAVQSADNATILINDSNGIEHELKVLNNTVVEVRK